MKLVLLSAGLAVGALSTTPALAHCRTIHHRIHRVAWHAPVRHHVVRYAACGCGRRVAVRHTVYPTVYRRPPVVEVTYEEPVYRPYPVAYPVPLYRPHPIFYGARFGGPRFHHWEHAGFYGRGRRGGGWR